MPADSPSVVLGVAALVVAFLVAVGVLLLALVAVLWRCPFRGGVSAWGLKAEVELHPEPDEKPKRPRKTA